LIDDIFLLLPYLIGKSLGTTQENIQKLTIWDQIEGVIYVYGIKKKSKLFLKLKITSISNRMYNSTNNDFFLDIECLV